MKSKYSRKISAFLLVVFLYQLIFPSVSYALTGGPSQPEVQSFEPVGTSQMVDLFSGDFNYNIPIFDVDGYPLNIAYHSGVTMDQEASWVGLGWNLNPGVINRNMRGIPDDFSGDKITKELRHKTDYTVGINTGFGAELFGFKLPKGINIGVNLGINYNNYKGMGYEFGLTPSASFGDKIKGNLNIGLNYSSQGGATLSPHAGLTGNLEKIGKYDLQGSIGGGFNLNSRQGLKNMTLSGSLSATQENLKKIIKNEKGEIISEEKTNVNSSHTLGSNMSFNSFSTNTYVPTVTMPMRSMNIGFSFKVGPDFSGFHGSWNVGGYYSSQWLQTQSVDKLAYGAQYLENSKVDEDMVDFNREKDGSFSAENPVIGIPQLTNDLFNYSGQGIGGMFKSYRNEIALVHDPANKIEPSEGGSLGVEVGGGNLIKYGADVTYNYSSGFSRPWGQDGKNVIKDLGIDYRTKDPQSNPLFEPQYFKTIGEKTVVDKQFNPYVNLKQEFPISLTNISNYFIRNKDRKYSRLTGINIDGRGSYTRDKRDKRNVHIKVLRADEKEYCLDETIDYQTPLGTIASSQRNQNGRSGHHNSEITLTKPDGSRFVYGIPAYNWEQKEYSFTNAKEPDKMAPNIFCETGEVAYDPNFGNYKGIDEHKEVITTPAYAHSYLLTEVLSSDYIDIDGNGPSVNDYGNYTKINYYKVNDSYKWRVPYNENRANYNEGLKSDQYDDNANIIYGKKEVWHVRTIAGKNHTAFFYISARNDAYGVKGESGGRGDDQLSYRLDSISLFSNYDSRSPIKTVHFVYGYDLCPNVPNNTNFDETKYYAYQSDYNTLYAGSGIVSGKLTLKEIYFTYGTSHKGKYNSYIFDYRQKVRAFNAPYHLKGYDMWGNYKPAAINLNGGDELTYTCNNNSVLLSKEFPYVEQDKNTADLYTAQWSLSSITLPTGGKIEVQYESDDYAYVQDKQANQMYRLLGFGNTSNGSYGDLLYTDGGDKNYNYLYFTVPNNTTPSDLIKNIDYMYYNVLTNIDHNTSNYEYIRGYAKIDDSNPNDMAGVNGTTAWVKIRTERLSDRNGDQIHPIAAAGFNFTRLHLPERINPGSNTLKNNFSVADNIGEFAYSLIGFWAEMLDIIVGKNRRMVENKFCQGAVPKKSWIRLNNTTGFKYGGGSRVKKLISSDVWDFIKNGNNNTEANTNKYTQKFDYTTVEGDKVISSGVASWEPQSGGDENPHRTLASQFSKENTGVPDEQYYSEYPYGESYYPGASVGYSKVSVINGNDTYESTKLSRNGTGKVVNEFYTAKDFPTISGENKAEADESKDSFIWTLLYSSSYKSLTMAQSQLIELNDMHGKPKAVWNFNQKNINSTDPSKAYSGVKYEYFEDNTSGQRRISNDVNVIYPNGNIQNATVGVDAEVVIDSRQSETYSFSGGIDLNLDAMFIAIFPLAILTGFPSMSQEETWFQSASSVKVVNRYGILKSTTAYEEGATLTTENTLFDSETGEVISTKTQNEFDDNLYNTTYPAHWAYDGMGGAYKNQGAELYLNVTGVNLYVKINGSNYDPKYFLSHGDLIGVVENDVHVRYWAYNDVSDGTWKLMDESGKFVSISSSNPTGYNFTGKIISSGRKNMQNMPIAQYTQLAIPYKNGALNIDSVLNVSVNEYDSVGKINNCFTKEDIPTKCPSQEARMLFQWLVDKNYFTISHLNDTNYYKRDGNFRIETIDTTLSESHGFDFNDKSKYEFKKVHDLCFPINRVYKVRLFGRRIGNSSTPDSLLQYEFGYETEPIDTTINCINYKFKLEAKGLTYNMDTIEDLPNGKYYPHDTIPALCSIPSIPSLNNICLYTTNKNIANSTQIVDIYSGASTDSCDCNPKTVWEGPDVANSDVNTGYCFDGDLGYMYQVKYPNRASYNYGPTAGEINKDTLPYPFNIFYSRGNPQTRSIIKVSNGSVQSYARNFKHYFLAQNKQTQVCNFVPIGSTPLNPFKNGLQGNWRSKRSWVYVEKRIPETGSTNIRKDGTYKTFDNFWKRDANSKLVKDASLNSKWQFTKEVTKYNTNGAELESKNTLNIYNATLYAYNNTLPVAVANNSKYSQLLALNFEKDNSQLSDSVLHTSCPAVHQTFDLERNLIDTNYYHTGNCSYKITNDAKQINSSYVDNYITQYLTTHATSSSAGYLTKASDYIGVFEPDLGKYVFSAWVKVGEDESFLDYSNAGVKITIAPAPTASSPQTTTITLRPSGPIIEGWQKIEGTFEIVSGMQSVSILLLSGANQTAYFDDLRVYPFKAVMNSYVYDPQTLKLLAQLDENNYATFYEYDKEGNLIRVKKETEKGIVTIKESRNSFIKKQSSN